MAAVSRPTGFSKRTADEKPRPQGIYGRGQSGVGIPVNMGCLGDILAPDAPRNIRRFTYLSNRNGPRSTWKRAALLRQPRPRTAVMSRAATTPNATAATKPLSSPLRLTVKPVTSIARPATTAATWVRSRSSLYLLDFRAFSGPDHRIQNQAIPKLKSGHRSRQAGPGR